MKLFSFRRKQPTLDFIYRGQQEAHPSEIEPRWRNPIRPLTDEEIAIRAESRKQFEEWLPETTEVKAISGKFAGNKLEYPLYVIHNSKSLKVGKNFRDVQIRKDFYIDMRLFNPDLSRDRTIIRRSGFRKVFPSFEGHGPQLFGFIHYEDSTYLASKKYARGLDETFRTSGDKTKEKLAYNLGYRFGAMATRRWYLIGFCGGGNKIHLDELDNVIIQEPRYNFHNKGKRKNRLGNFFSNVVIETYANFFLEQNPALIEAFENGIGKGFFGKDERIDVVKLTSKSIKNKWSYNPRGYL